MICPAGQGEHEEVWPLLHQVHRAQQGGGAPQQGRNYIFRNNIEIFSEILELNISNEKALENVRQLKAKGEHWKFTQRLEINVL